MDANLNSYDNMDATAAHLELPGVARGALLRAEERAQRVLRAPPIRLCPAVASGGGLYA